MGDSGNEKLEEGLVLEAGGEVLHLGVVHEEHALVIHVIEVFTDLGLR